MTPEAAEKIKHDPKGSMTKMFSGTVFGHAAGDKREFIDEQDLMGREVSISPYNLVSSRPTHYARWK